MPLNGVNSGESTVEILAGYELQDANGNSLLAGELENGTPVFISADRDIDASGSGVIAQNAILNASGDITGLIFARNNIDLNAQQNVNVTALAQGTVNVSAGDNVSGTIIGIGGHQCQRQQRGRFASFPKHQRQRGCKRHGRFRARQPPPMPPARIRKVKILPKSPILLKNPMTIKRRKARGSPWRRSEPGDCPVASEELMPLKLKFKIKN